MLSSCKNDVYKKMNLTTKKWYNIKQVERFLLTLPNSQQCEHIAIVALYGLAKLKIVPLR